VLVKRLLAAKGPVAFIAIVYWSVGWEIEALVVGLLTVERPGRTRRTRILECGLWN
jgi:hypothetical protein